ncbi:MAG TPA: YciI family protein [Hyphomicrobiales bacterium]|nr:YciI family protein [Hyphomicrobiales bacterium]
MLFVVHCLDKPDALPRRLAVYDEHKARLAKNEVPSVISGPLVAADGETMIGSLLILDAASRAEVEAYIAADPFTAADVWASVSIERFHMRVDNRR